MSIRKRYWRSKNAGHGLKIETFVQVAEVLRIPAEDFSKRSLTCCKRKIKKILQNQRRKTYPIVQAAIVAVLTGVLLIYEGSKMVFNHFIYRIHISHSKTIKMVGIREFTLHFTHGLKPWGCVSSKRSIEG